MSIRFFGYSASEQTAKEAGRGLRARYLSGFLCLELCARNVPNISVGLYPSPFPASLLAPLIVFTGAASDAPFDPRPDLSSYFSRYFSDPVFLRRLPFFPLSGPMFRALPELAVA